MRFTDQQLATRLELGETEASRRCMEALRRLRPALGAAAEPIAGGYAFFAGVGSPLTQALGVAMTAPLTEDDAARMEKFFQSRGARTEIECCPLADPSLLERLTQRGYRVLEWSNVLFRPITAGESFAPEPDGIQVIAAAREQAAECAEVAMQGFATALPNADLIRPALHGLYESETTRTFLALVDGIPAGVGGMSLHNGLATLFGAATLEAYRGRGIQNAIFRARLASAVASGCDMAMTITAPASGSQRNAERQGFRVAYTRTKMFRELS
jgi:ribosomal protein S18 acetylase RimI-like enzyme